MATLPLWHLVFIVTQWRDQRFIWGLWFYVQLPLAWLLAVWPSAHRVTRNYAWGRPWKQAREAHEEVGQVFCEFCYFLGSSPVTLSSSLSPCHSQAFLFDNGASDPALTLAFRNGKIKQRKNISEFPLIFVYSNRWIFQARWCKHILFPLPLKTPMLHT